MPIPAMKKLEDASAEEHEERRGVHEN